MPPQEEVKRKGYVTGRPLNTALMLTIAQLGYVAEWPSTAAPCSFAELRLLWRPNSVIKTSLCTSAHRYFPGDGGDTSAMLAKTEVRNGIVGPTSCMRT